MLKAFMGVGYLTVAFAFHQSGLWLGIFGLVFIASLTDYCCYMIVTVKYHCIEKVIEIHRASIAGKKDVKKVDYSTNIMISSSLPDGDHNSAHDSDTSDRDEIIEIDQESFLRQHMMKNMTYGDVGKMSMGNFGQVIVTMCIALSQFGFCIAYFIFIGNTIYSLFPGTLCYNGTINTNYTDNVSLCKMDQLTIKEVRMKDNTFKRSLEKDIFLDAFATGPNVSVNESGSPVTSSLESSKSTGEANITQRKTTDSNKHLLPLIESEQELKTSVVSTRSTTAYQDPSHYWSVMSDTEDDGAFRDTESVLVYISSAPNLKLLIIAPVPVFIAFSLIRNVRNLGWINITADLAIIIGCVSLMSYILTDFSVADSVIGKNWEGLGVFFGILSGTFEGIALIIPIESSMEGNRHNFFLFLHITIGFFTFLISSFGILGYLRFGAEVKQMLNMNIPPTTSISFVVNICVCIGVLLTFPLQMYPPVKIAETYMFAEGKIFGPKPKPQSKDRVALLKNEENMDEDERRVLLPKVPANLPLPVAAHIPESVATWKRMMLRFFLVLLAAGLAVAFRDSFAYVNAFIGAVGCSLLAFILPCLFYLKLCWSDLNIATKTINITIVILGICCSIVSLYVIIKKLVENTSV